MKMVTLTRDMRPWRQGDRVPMPNGLADALVTAGEAADPAEWGEPTVAAAPAVVASPVTPARPAAAAGFATRRKGA